MKVSVKFYAHLGNLVDRKSKIEFDLKDGATISHLLDELFLDSKNGREIKFLNGMNTLLESDDEISIFPLVAGG